MLDARRPEGTTAVARGCLAAGPHPNVPVTASADPPAPVVSVLMPSYDADATIIASVRSALAQTVSGLEVIVVDDGSRRPAAEVLAEIDDPRIRVVRTQRNRGVSAARNTALALAKAPIVAQLDADDCWHASHVAGLLDPFSDRAVGLVYANAEVIGHPEGRDRWLATSPQSDREHDSVTPPRHHPVEELAELYRGNPIPAVAVAMRRDAALAVGGYPEWLTVGEDYMLYLRLRRAGWRFAFVDELSAVYRWPEPGRGATADRRRNVRQQVKLYAVLTAQSPQVFVLWRRLGRELVELVTTHLPATLRIWSWARTVAHGRRARLRDATSGRGPGSPPIL